MGSPVAFSTNAMKKPVAKWALSAAVGVCVLAGVFVLARRNAMVDFSDNPALLVQVSEAGTVTLDTYQGRIVAPLAGVNWKTNSALLTEAQKLVREAQREKVAFRKSKSGESQIWYETESGPESLNEKLIVLFGSGVAPNPK